MNYYRAFMMNHQMRMRGTLIIFALIFFCIVSVFAAPAPVVISVTPATAINETNISLIISGSGFEPGAEILLTPVNMSPVLLSTTVGKTEEMFLVQPMDLVALENYLYLFDLGNSFTIVNISDPYNPVRTGRISLRTKGIAVATKGHYAYITGGGALDIIDISDPAKPVPAGYVSNDNSGTILREGFGIGISGNHVFIPSVLTDSLEVFDVTDREKPVFRARITNRDFGSKINNPNNIFVSGNYAYLTSAASNAFEIIDISNPRMPDHKGFLANGEGGALLTTPSSVYVKGNYAYVTSYGNNALEIIDISNPEKPVHAASLTNGETGAWLSGPYGVKVSGNYLFVGTDHTLEMIDITDPLHPHHKFSTNNDSSPFIHGPGRAFDIRWRYAYVTRSKVGDGFNLSDIEPKNMLDIFDIGFIPATNISIYNPKNAMCSVDLSGRHAGMYNLVVTNPDGQFGVLEGGFEIPESDDAKPGPDMPKEALPKTTPTAGSLPFSPIAGILFIGIIFRKLTRE